jgi:hypothetical protein
METCFDFGGWQSPWLEARKGYRRLCKCAEIAALGPEQPGWTYVFCIGFGLRVGSGRTEHQTTNLGVGSSNLSGRASKPLLLQMHYQSLNLSASQFPVISPLCRHDNADDAPSYRCAAQSAHNLLERHPDFACVDSRLGGNFARGRIPQMVHSARWKLIDRPTAGIHVRRQSPRCATEAQQSHRCRQLPLDPANRLVDRLEPFLVNRSPKTIQGSRNLEPIQPRSLALFERHALSESRAAVGTIAR